MPHPCWPGHVHAFPNALGHIHREASGVLQANRHLMRRMAAMAGGGHDVDPGSEDESEIFDGLFESEGMHEAQMRARRLEPFIRCTCTSVLYVSLCRDDT